ncbi:thioredoxin [Rhizoctonia solani]|uniref:Thioredoxin n=1 Tax=Rhizoctonia solani TaxID=456999 RepID=A0A8H8NNL1_9AGAM|nr:thioredoxin [Rhizoctonia solani]QRW15750.1 thioredoxin [Rhizoctonia solani]
MSLTSKFYATTLAVVLAILAIIPSTRGEHLTQADFTSSIGKGLWLVEFYSPYCPHCKRFAPAWDKVAKEKAPLEGISGFTMAQVNCIAQGDLCSDNQVTGYPQVMLFKEGKKMEEYSGDRTPADLSSWIDKRVADYAQSSASESDSVSSTAHLNPSGEVVVLTPETFDKALSEGPIFIKFYAPWCGHCKKLAPVWTELATKTKGRVNIAEVNCEQYGSLCKSQSVDGYPMLFFYHSGQKVDFRGSRKIEPLEQFVLRAVAPGVQSITIEEVDSVLKKESVFFLVLYTYSTPQLYLDDIEEAAKPLLGTPVVYKSRNPDVFKKFDVDPADGPALIVVKDHETKPFSVLPLSTQTTVPILGAFFQHHRIPTLQQLTAENFPDVMKHPAKPLVVLAAIDMENMPKTQLGEEIEKLTSIAKRWQTSAVRLTDTRPTIFVWMDGDRWSKWLKRMYGIKREDMPTVVIVDHSRLLYYDADAGKARLKLERESIFAALESAYLGLLRPKHSENFVERTMRSMNDRMEYVGSSAWAHPFVTAGIVVGFLSGSLWLIRRLVNDDLPTGSYQSTRHQQWKPSHRLD